VKRGLELAAALLLGAVGAVTSGSAQMPAQRTPNPASVAQAQTQTQASAPGAAAPVPAKPYPQPQIDAQAGAGIEEPDFVLKDQDGQDFQLRKQRGHWVLLFFYRGYWCPYCMTEMRDFAEHADELEKLDVRLVAISVDDQQHAHDVWEKVAQEKFTVLSDPDLTVIRRYGLLHTAGHSGNDIALRTTVFVGQNGREQWRRVSHAVPDIPSWQKTLADIKKAQAIPQRAAPGIL
jgi:peroxiredoxin